MSKTNTGKDRLSKKHLNDSDDWDDQGVDGRYDSDTPEKNDRVNRKKNAEARRRYEEIREDLRLKELTDGDRWF